MAVITKKPRERLIAQSGARGTREALLAGPSSGCNRFTVKRLSLDTDGITARLTEKAGAVYFVHSGGVTLSHGEGELDVLEAGDTAVAHPGEVHRLHSNLGKKSMIMVVTPQ